MMNQRPKPLGRRAKVKLAILDRLRQGPLPTAEIVGSTTPGAQRLHIHDLRVRGYDIQLCYVLTEKEEPQDG
jgi:hypothetical protein